MKAATTDILRERALSQGDDEGFEMLNPDEEDININGNRNNFKDTSYQVERNKASAAYQGSAA